MKKSIQRLLFAVMLLFAQQLLAQRYLTEVFSNVSVTTNVIYGQNVSVLQAPTLATIPLKADVYEPVGDVLTARPTIIILHTGSWLPPYYNGQPTGTKGDSAVVEMCHQFARRGYTAIAMDYRQGWNPSALGPTGQDIRTGTLLCAVGRSLQDAKACVRYFRNNANTTNDYHIDESKIIMGGLGSGGYIALAYATIDSYSEISLPKFLAAANNPSYQFTAGVSYFDSTKWGNTDGYGGLSIFNISTNTPGVSNSIAFAFNMGGAIGDSSWLEVGDVPMVCFHVINDPFAPYIDGPVIVPTTGDFVVDVSGSHTIIRKADEDLNNATFQNNTWTDPYTVRANQINNGYDGLFPFDLPDPPGPATGQAGPWDWYDSTTTYSICLGVLGFSPGRTDSVWYGSLSTDPDMSKAKGLAYIDTVMGYLNPRIAAALGLPTYVNNSSQLEKIVSVFPNPATDCFYIGSSDYSSHITHVRMYDVAGRMVRSLDDLNINAVKVDTKSLEAGTYVLKIGFDKGEVVKKITLQ